MDTSQLRPLTLEVGNVQTPLFAEWKAIASAFVYGKGVGCGASCAVMYHPTLNTEVSYKARAVGRMVSIDKCEVDGIILGIDLIIQYIH